MSKSDFQDRLQRIGASSHQGSSVAPGPASIAPARAKKPGIGRFVIGGASLALGSYMVRHANVNYEALRDSSGIGVLALLGLGGMALTLLGAIMMWRAIFARQVATKKAVRQASKTARVTTALLGFALGTAALFTIAMSTTASQMETEAAKSFMIGSSFLVLLVTFVVFLVGIVGLFLRGRSLVRVPVYYVFGVVITFAIVWILRVDMLDWPQLEAALQ